MSRELLKWLTFKIVQKSQKVIKTKVKETTFASKERIYPEKVGHAARCSWDSLILLTIEALAL
jgi:hypothetical protein